MSTPQPAKRPRHLMDPDNPVRMAPASDRNLTQVQKWVMSVLVATTVLHLSAGLVIAAAYVASGKTDAKIGLLVIAGIFGVLGVAAARAIHKASLVTPWLVVGVIPSVIGAFWIFG